MRARLHWVLGAVAVGCVLPELNKVDDPPAEDAGSGSSAGNAGAVSAGSGAEAQAGEGGGDGEAVMDCSEPPSAPSGALAVGSSGLALQWTGNEWTQTASTFGTMRAVWAKSPTDAWAFGDGGVGAHWDGFAWQTDYTAGDITIKKLAGNATLDEVWALNEASGFYRLQGTMWLPVTGPPGFVPQILDIWLSPSGKLYAAAAIDSVWVRDPATDSWSEFAHVGMASSMGVLSGTADDDIWFYVRTSATFRHYDGALFTTVAAPPGGLDLHAITTSPTTGWSVGDGGLLWTLSGGSWLSLVSDSTRILYGVARHADDQAWVVGDGGTILHVAGGRACPIPSNTTAPIFSVWSPVE